MISRRGFIASLLTLPLVGKALVAAGVRPIRYIYPKPIPDRLFCMMGHIQEHDGMKQFRPFQLDKGEFGKKLNDPELNKFTLFYMPDAPEYPEMKDEISYGGSYMIGDTLLMPKCMWGDKYVDYDGTTKLIGLEGI